MQRPLGHPAAGRGAAAGPERAPAAIEAEEGANALLSFGYVTPASTATWHRATDRGETCHVAEKF